MRQFFNGQSFKHLRWFSVCTTNFTSVRVIPHFRIECSCFVWTNVILSMYSIIILDAFKSSVHIRGRSEHLALLIFIYLQRICSLIPFSAFFIELWTFLNTQVYHFAMFYASHTAHTILEHCRTIFPSFDSFTSFISFYRFTGILKLLFLFHSTPPPLPTISQSFRWDCRNVAVPKIMLFARAYKRISVDVFPRVISSPLRTPQT